MKQRSQPDGVIHRSELSPRRGIAWRAWLPHVFMATDKLAAGILITKPLPVIAAKQVRALRRGLRRARFFVPRLPPLGPLPGGPLGAVGLGVTLLAMLAFFGVFFSYLYQLHQTVGTHAEDLGIMDQVLWNTAHGHFWRETICNAVSDRNCLGDASRWGIHFEPLMLTLVPLYWVIPGPHTLQFVQVAGVALGALPAYWLGSRRFQQVAGGVALAVGYLLLPVLRAAVVDDFHMVTLSAPLLMLALYALYARQNRTLLIACLLALGTKEQVPLDVFMLGMAALLLQRRGRLGVGLMVLAVAWAVVALGVIHLASPLGASPTAGRYDGVLGTLHRLVLVQGDPARNGYLHLLLGNTGQLGYLAPWMVLLAAPSALLNALSADPHQYAGIYQYNADIAPFLVVAALEGVLFARFAVGFASHWIRRGLALPRPTVPFLRAVVAMVVVGWALVSLPVVPQLTQLNPNIPPATVASPPWQTGWPHATAHLREAARFFGQIPAEAAVTAQADLVPHLSERRGIYQFPDGVGQAQYVLVDILSDYYPEPTEVAYTAALRPLLQSGQFTLVDADDGYLLLRRVTSGTAPPIVVPPTFCAQQPVTTADAIAALHIIGNCGSSGGPSGT